MSPSRAVRVVIVDDHPTFCTGLGLIVQAMQDLDVVSEVSGGEDALSLLQTMDRPPDVVTLDIQLPGISGIETARRISTQFNSGPRTAPGVLVLSVDDDDDAVIAALRAGVRGYLTKDASRDELVRAIQVVASGGSVFGQAISARLSTYFNAIHLIPRRVIFPNLTQREIEVLDLVARGYENRRIARELVVAEKTVRNHIHHIFFKLEVADRAAAIVRARDAGLGL